MILSSQPVHSSGSDSRSNLALAALAVAMVCLVSLPLPATLLFPLGLVLALGPAIGLAELRRYGGPKLPFPIAQREG